MKTILVPIDFSPISRRVIAEAVELAEEIGSRVVLFFSVPPSPIIATDLMPLVGPVLDYTDDARKAAKAHLRRLQLDWGKRGVVMDTVCAEGHPATRVLEQATRSGK